MGKRSFQRIELSVPSGGLPGLAPVELQKHVVRAVTADARLRRLLSPAEAVNVLTVGAVHDDASMNDEGRTFRGQEQDGQSSNDAEAQRPAHADPAYPTRAAAGTTRLAIKRAAGPRRVLRVAGKQQGVERLPPRGRAILVPRLATARRPATPDVGGLSRHPRALPIARASNHSPSRDASCALQVYPREEPSAGKPHARICEGEAEWLSYSTRGVKSYGRLDLRRRVGPPAILAWCRSGRATSVATALTCPPERDLCRSHGISEQTTIAGRPSTAGWV